MKFASTRLAHIALPLVAALALTLSGCSRQESPGTAAVPAATPAQPYEAVAA